MTDDLRRDPRTPFAIEVEEAVVVELPWVPNVAPEEERWSRQLADEVQPLVDSLRRLRERGLLD
jgi:hypothetical protein